jgi:molecular chaperone DnaJ
VPTLTGRVLLRIPPETQNGRVFRLKGQGLPEFRGKDRGDLLVKTRVVLPTGLSPEAREAAVRFLELVNKTGDPGRVDQ